jgi:deazaflavin-dependent oxidoreductase (nitroreductase family)
VLLETTGRRTGSPGRTPVGARRDGKSLWVVAEHGRRAGYVRNIEADPRVRVKIGRRWHPARGAVLADDDWRRRLREIGRGRPDLKLNSGVVRVMKTEPVTVRLDLH